MNDQQEASGSQAIKAAIIDLYETILWYMIRLACLGHGRNISIGKDAGVQFKAEMNRKKRAIERSSSGHEIGEQLRRLADFDDRRNIASPPVSDDVGFTHFGEEVLKPLDRGIRQHLQRLLDCRPEYTSFCDWKGKHVNNRIFRITGAPGSGKSMLLAAIIEDLTERSLHNAETPHMAYFICNNGKASPENASALLQSLVLQVLHRQLDLSEHLSRAKRMTGRELFQNPADFRAISTVFCDILQDDGFQETCFIIDSIDECHVSGNEKEARKSFEDLLRLVATTTRLSSKVWWLVTMSSDKDSTGLGEIYDTQEYPLLFQLDSNPDAMRPAAMERIAVKVEHLARSARNDKDFRKRVEAKFLEKSSANLLWVDVACEAILSSGSPWNATEILDDLPSGIGPLYTKLKSKVDEPSLNMDANYCEKVLTTLAVSYRPLHITELRDIISLPSSVDLEQMIRNKCSSFLAIRDGRVHFIHQSAKEFMAREIKSPATVHEAITGKCLEFLSNHFGTPATLSTSYDSGGEAEKQDHYAISSWPMHLIESKSIAIVSSVAKFLEEHYWHWISQISTSLPDLPQSLTQIALLENSLKVRIPELSTASHCKLC